MARKREGRVGRGGMAGRKGGDMVGRERPVREGASGSVITRTRSQNLDERLHRRRRLPLTKLHLAVRYPLIHVLFILF